MDKVKVVLAQLKKHHFWVLLCGAVVLLPVGVSWIATGSVRSRIDERVRQLTAEKTDISTIGAKTLHPSEKVIQAVRDEHDKMVEEVYRAWQVLYREQFEKNQWPSQLGDKFLTVIYSLDAGDPIPEDQRADYMYFINRHFKELYEIVNIRLPQEIGPDGVPVVDEEGNPKKIDPLEQATSPTGFSGGDVPQIPGTTPSAYARSRASGVGDMVGIVEWNIANLQQLRARLHWPSVPTTSQVRLAQEDLWVYEALLRIVDQTNAGATSHYNAPVKRIEALQMGQDVARAFMQLRGPTSTMSSESGPGSPGASAFPGSPGMGPGVPGPSMPGSYYPGGNLGSQGTGGVMMSGDQESEAGFSTSTPGGTSDVSADQPSPDELWRRRLTAYRYLDKDGQPLPVNAEGGVDHPFDQFKMMPVRMALVMDQRQIPELLVNCANSSMPVVARQVRINPQGGTLDMRRLGSSMMRSGPTATGNPYMSTSGLTHSGDGYGEGSVMPSDGYPGGSYPGGSYPGRSQAGGAGARRGSYDLPVEILGIIYIFNKPDAEKLAAGGVEELTASPVAQPELPEGEPPVTPPVEPPGTGPAAPPPTPTPAGTRATPGAGNP